MARYDLDYGRGYGQDYSRSGWRRSSAGSGYRRYGVSPERMAGRSRYGREYGRFREGRGFRAGGRFGREPPRYGLGYGGYGSEYAAGYGREFEKSRWQTDYGDPFHDRERGTPIRMIRGEYGEYGEEFRGTERMRGQGYGLEYRSRRRRWLY